MRLVCYSLKNLNSSEKAKLNRELRGFEDRSNHGTYTYQRKGMLGGIKNRTVYLAGIVVDDKNAERIASLLRKYKAWVHVTRIKKSP